MNRILLLLLSFALFFNTNAQTKKAKITFDEELHNFGTFKEEAGSQTYVFKFKNTGNATLTLSDVKASCGCTTPEWPRSPIAAGKTGEIIVTYNPHNRPGPFDKSITIKSNASTPTKVLKIKGNVLARKKTAQDLYPEEIMGLRLQSKHIAFTKVYSTKTKQESIDIINTTDKDMKIEFEKIPKHIKIWVEPKVLKPKQKAKIIAIYDAKIKNDWGFVMDKVSMKINDESNGRTRLSISASIEEDFTKMTPSQIANAPKITVDNKVYDFGAIKNGAKKTHTFILTNKGKADLIIRKIKSNCGCTIAKIDKKIIKPRESINLKTTFDSIGRSGKQNKSITIITNDPKNNSIRLKIKGNVQ